MSKKHPMQPIEIYVDGIVRFKRNRIVCHLLNVASRHGVDMNELVRLGFSKEDHSQFAQLLGYSVSGFGELPYAHKKDVAKADFEASKLYGDDDDAA